VVTHDQRIMSQGDRVIHMKDGRIASDVFRGEVADRPLGSLISKVPA
jgi:ABC-type lipoprotein export system ATPase subunit